MRFTADSSYEAQAFRALASCFYEAVPLEFRTRSDLTAEVARKALEREGIESELVPCQLWYAAPQSDHVVGFVGRGREHGGWDGHVICATREQFIDTATFQLERDFAVRVPPVMTGPRFSVPSQAIARCDLSATERLWWHNPPAGADAGHPGQLPTLITRLADAVHEQMRRRLGAFAL